MSGIISATIGAVVIRDTRKQCARVSAQIDHVVSDIHDHIEAQTVAAFTSGIRQRMREGGIPERN